MCGIAGLWDFQAAISDEALQVDAQNMAASLKHRGPDASGAWCDEKTGIALSHARLAIIDLSESGRQPMVSASGRYIIAYNGEIYNFTELRRELEATGLIFKGHSDTEVLLEACSRWGVEETVSRLIGMFAFALWDRQDKRFTLVRDRMGIKPLYWGWSGKRLVFASELKAFQALDGFEPAIDADALASYFRYGYVPAPSTVYRDVKKLEPGCMLTVESGGSVESRAYWSLSDVFKAAPFDGTETEALEALETLLSDAVDRRMIADVPLGAFLSGGIDSSLVVALMQAKRNESVRTFSIGFDQEGYNEAGHAKAVAAHLGTDHTELYVSPGEAQGVISDLPDYYDEPFADSSQIPTFLVSRMTRKHVTVALSGDGGDELFAGYNRYTLGETLWRKSRVLPGFMRNAAAGTIRCLTEENWDGLTGWLPGRPAHFGLQMHRGARALEAETAEALHRGIVSLWENPSQIVPTGREVAARAESLEGLSLGVVEQMQAIDQATYLPDDILTKVDRASMAVSLEARVPLLDHRVVEFAARLPRHLKVRAGKGKWILRTLLARHIPQEMIDRPKMGFSIPLAQWLRGPLRDWAEDLLSEAELKKCGLLDPAPVRKAWTEHLSGRVNRSAPLWAVLMFQAWHRRWMEKRS